MVVIVRIIIPVNQRYVFRNVGIRLFGIFAVNCIIIADRKPQLYKHIAPYHGFETVFCGYFADPVKMADDQIVALLIAVERKMLSEADAEGLVHSYMYSFG